MVPTNKDRNTGFVYRSGWWENVGLAPAHTSTKCVLLVIFRIHSFQLLWAPICFAFVATNADGSLAIGRCSEDLTPGNAAHGWYFFFFVCFLTPCTHRSFNQHLSVYVRKILYLSVRLCGDHRFRMLEIVTRHRCYPESIRPDRIARVVLADTLQPVQTGGGYRWGWDRSCVLLQCSTSPIKC